MNSAVIVKIEWKLKEADQFSVFDMIPHSGTLSENKEETAAGEVFTFNAGFKIARSQLATDKTLEAIRGQKVVFKITDANDVVYLLNDLRFRSRFSYTRRLDGTPGSFNGYDCQISRNSTERCASQ